MTAAARLSLLLQHADSFFPGGQTSFSWGLEQLTAEGRISNASALHRLAEAQLRLRWTSFDRAFLTAGHSARANPPELAALDRLCEASIAASELREGSARAGRALLAVHGRLGTPGIDPFRRSVETGEAHGHLPVVQGLVWGALGFSEAEATALSAYGVVAGLAAAAIRLGLIGHIEAQRLIAGTGAVVAELTRSHPPSPAEAVSFAPAVEIAAMRHETAEQRLFAN